MANNLSDGEVSLLTKCYPSGTLPPEIDGEGNIEYKVGRVGHNSCVDTQLIIFILQLKLINPSLERLEHLITQMKWR